MAQGSVLSETPVQENADAAPAVAAGGPAPETPGRRARRLRRMQAIVSLALLAVVLLTSVAVSFMAHSRTLHRMLLNRELSSWKATNGLYSYHPGYIDAEDWMLLDAVPKAHFPHGGVVFMGSSTTQHAVMPWTLPRAQRPYVQDFAMESANYTEQYQWVRFLTKDHNLLQAGPKMLIVLGLAYFDMRLKIPGTTDANFVPELFKRYGWYRYSRRTGIHRVAMNPWKRWWMRERLRDYDFLECALTDLRLPTSGWHPGAARTPATNHAARKFNRGLLGHSQWRYAMKTELAQLNAMMGYIQAHGAHVRVVLLPLSSWNDSLPYPRAYDKRVRAVCKKRGIRIVNLQHAVPDSGFYDAGHLNYTGERQISPILLGIAQRHLRRIGLGQ